MKKLIAALALVLTLGSVQIAQARDWDHDNDRWRHDNGRHNGWYHNNWRHNDRVIVRNYYPYRPYYATPVYYSPYDAGFWSPPGYYYPSYGTSLSFNFR